MKLLGTDITVVLRLGQIFRNSFGLADSCSARFRAGSRAQLLQHNPAHPWFSRLTFGDDTSTRALPSLCCCSSHYTANIGHHVCDRAVSVGYSDPGSTKLRLRFS